MKDKIVTFHGIEGEYLEKSSIPGDKGCGECCFRRLNRMDICLSVPCISNACYYVEKENKNERI